MQVIRTKEFKKSLTKLPTKVQQQLEGQLLIFTENWRDPRLHTKKLKGLDGVYSFRVFRAYRGLFYFQNEYTIILFEIDHRKDVYKH